MGLINKYCNLKNIKIKAYASFVNSKMISFFGLSV